MEKNNPIIDQTLFDLKLNEAQFYLEQGLYDEADKIYVSLINELKQLPETKSSDIQIRQLEAIRQEYQTETKKDKVVVKVLSDVDKRSDEVGLKKSKIHQNDQDKFTQHHKAISKDEDYNIGELNNDDINSDIDSQIVAFINQMIIEAFNKNASDIYIEPTINYNNLSANFVGREQSGFKHYPDKSSDSNIAKIRFRIDGICQAYTGIPNKFALHVIFKIKVMAKMDITVRATPLYGKIKFKSEPTGAIELKAITIPTSGGKEDIVLKFFPAAKSMELQTLGFLEHNLKKFVEVINRPFGLILVSGLSGSGKTTTLHSALKLINRPEKKIWCAEHPIEITQRGISQVEVQPQKGLNYPELIKAFIKSGADVIMLGEIIDFSDKKISYETTSLAIKASLTGHLIFAGVNASSISDTISELLEIGVNPIHFSNALLCILNQKLIRRLCEKCREPVSEENSKNILDMAFDEFGKGESLLVDSSRDTLGLFNQIDKDKIRIYNHSPDGCEDCGYTGYKGRVALHELLINNDLIKSLIKETSLKETNFIEKAEEGSMNRVSYFERVNCAINRLDNSNIFAAGSYTLKQDGILKVIAGITDIDEIRRNTV
ncbi:MAG: Flp pilus assembly complex ATPase component TadA [Desulfamplus sp.]|nr:Flp pilus assembly complex ATPase component TadA [Desulfamplus sp.]